MLPFVSSTFDPHITSLCPIQGLKIEFLTIGTGFWGELSTDTLRLLYKPHIVLPSHQKASTCPCCEEWWEAGFWAFALELLKFQLRFTRCLVQFRLLRIEKESNRDPTQFSKEKKGSCFGCISLLGEACVLGLSRSSLARSRALSLSLPK